MTPEIGYELSIFGIKYPKNSVLSGDLRKVYSFYPIKSN